MGIVIVIVSVAGACVLLLLWLGSDRGRWKVTRATLLASYYAFRDKLGPDAPEKEVLLSVLGTRPLFSSYSESERVGIIESNGIESIDQLIAFVFGWEGHKPH
jgi:uncharacterized membrane protein YfcA